MKTNKEQKKNMTNENFVTFECKTDLRPKIVYSKGATGYRINDSFSWEADPNILLDATKDDKDYVSVDLGTAEQYDREHSEIYKAVEIYRKGLYAARYEEVFRCIIAKLDQEVNKTTDILNAMGEDTPLFHSYEYNKGKCLEAKYIRDYVWKLFNDESFRYRELYELLGDK